MCFCLFLSQSYINVPELIQHHNHKQYENPPWFYLFLFTKILFYYPVLNLCVKFFQYRLFLLSHFLQKNSLFLQDFYVTFLFLYRFTISLCWISALHSISATTNTIILFVKQLGQPYFYNEELNNYQPYNNIATTSTSIILSTNTQTTSTNTNHHPTTITLIFCNPRTTILQQHQQIQNNHPNTTTLTFRNPYTTIH